MAGEQSGSQPDVTNILADIQTILQQGEKPPWERRLWAFVAIIFSGSLFWMVHTVNESDKTLAVMSANFINLRENVQEMKLGISRVVTNVQFGDLKQRVGEIESEQIRMHRKINTFVTQGVESR